jgi:hypothetical protein
VAVAHFVATKEESLGALSNDIRSAVAAAYVRALRYRQASISGMQQRRLLDVLVSLQEKGAGGELVANWREAWAARYILPAGVARVATAPGPNSTAPPPIQDSEVITKAVALYAAAGDDARLEAIISQYGEAVGFVPGIWVQLIHSGKAELAARTINTNLARAGTALIVQGPVPYDPRLEANLPAVLEKLDSEEARFAIRWLVANLPDAEGDPSRDNPPKAPPTREARVRKVAQSFPAIKFTDAMLRKSLLVLLAESDPTNTAIFEALATEYSLPNVIAALAGQDSEQSRLELRLATAHTTYRLRNGDSQPYVELLQRVSQEYSAVNPQTDLTLRMAISTLLRSATNLFAGDPTAQANPRRASGADEGPWMWPPEQSAAVGKALREVLSNRVITAGEFRLASGLLIALHAHAERMNDLAGWAPTLPPAVRSRLRPILPDDDVWRIGAKLYRPANSATLAARARFVMNVARYAAERDLMLADGNPSRAAQANANPFTLDEIVRQGLVTAAEIKTHRAALFQFSGVPVTPQEVKTRELVMVALAGWLHGQGEPVAAAEVWRSVVKMLPAGDEANEDRVAYVLALANSLKDSGQLQEALDALNELDGGRVPAQLRGAFQRLKRQLEELQRTSRRVEAAKAGPGEAQRSEPRGGSEGVNAPKESPKNQQSAQAGRFGRGVLAGRGVLREPVTHLSASYSTEYAFPKGTIRV